MKKLTLLFVLLCSCALASQNPQPAWFRVIHDRELTEFVKKEAPPILRVAGVKPSDAYWFRFYVADLAQRGIAGMNNGKQMVYMDRAHTKAAKEDIAGKMALHVFRITLAHEIAHDVLGHVPNVQALSDAFYVGSTAADLGSSAPGAVGLISSLVSLGIALVGRASQELYTRANELEADLEAIKYWKRLSWDCTWWIKVYEAVSSSGDTGDFHHPTEVRLGQAREACQ